MSKSIIIGLFGLLFLQAPIFAQQGTGFGVKGGLNFNTSGKYFRDAGDIFSQPSQNMGYHLGVFYQLTSYDISLRPELIYTKTEFSTDLGLAQYQRIDMPVLVKLRLFQIIGFSIGPSFHYTLDEKFSAPELFEDTAPFSLGFQLGLGLNIGPVGLDLRFERELKERRYTLENVLGNEEFKNQQLILGLSFMIPSSKSK
ncbi:outer membrane beta-barrel protein [Algoriphagus confluentis]|uniref:Outer membrane protein beta-barrel domain-containing protein n=1 Tax=Algoriphagus confluentis TaxID=1697556 RepID=A0ABQ6PRA0_9BACT|nr:hypothetical protein Aconfl_23510 [Algoriphagus confluentis]